MVKNLPPDAGDVNDTSSIPGLGRCPRGGNGNPLQSSCMDDPMDRGHWQLEPMGSLTESDRTEAAEHARTHVCASYSPKCKCARPSAHAEAHEGFKEPREQGCVLRASPPADVGSAGGAGGALPPRPKPLPPAGPGGLFSVLEHLLSVLT